MTDKKKDNQTTALRFISRVAGRGKLYIVILLLVQMVLGISSVFYALLLRGIIDDGEHQFVEIIGGLEPYNGFSKAVLVRCMHILEMDG